MLRIFSGETKPEYRPREKHLHDVENHLYHIEGMLHAMRLAIMGIDKEHDGLALTLLVEAAEDDCELIRKSLRTKGGE